MSSPSVTQKASATLLEHATRVITIGHCTPAEAADVASIIGEAYRLISETAKDPTNEALALPILAAEQHLNKIEAAAQAKAREAAVALATPPATDPTLRDLAAASLAQTNEESAFRREPWRAQAATWKILLKKYGGTAVEALTGFFTDAAKGKHFSQDEVMACTYMLFGTEDAQKVYVQILLHHKGPDRVRAHNWFVWSLMDTTQQEQYGPKINDLRLPLFPPIAGLSFNNTTLLAEAGSTEGGSGASKGERLFKRDITPPKKAPKGAGWIPVHVDQHGQAAADTTEVEQAFNGLNNTLQKGLSTLAKRLDRVEGRVAQAAKAQPPRARAEAPPSQGGRFRQPPATRPRKQPHAPGGKRAYRPRGGADAEDAEFVTEDDDVEEGDS